MWYFQYLPYDSTGAYKFRWQNITREKDGTTGPIKPFLLRDYTLDANVLASLIAMHFRVIVPNLAQIVKAL